MTSTETTECRRFHNLQIRGLRSLTIPLTVTYCFQIWSNGICCCIHSNWKENSTGYVQRKCGMWWSTFGRFIHTMEPMVRWVTSICKLEKILKVIISHFSHKPFAKNLLQKKRQLWSWETQAWKWSANNQEITKGCTFRGNINTRESSKGEQTVTPLLIKIVYFKLVVDWSSQACHFKWNIQQYCPSQEILLNWFTTLPWKSSKSGMRITTTDIRLQDYWIIGMNRLFHQLFNAFNELSENVKFKWGPKCCSTAIYLLWHGLF